jgi:hypothetical protein
VEFTHGATRNGSEPEVRAAADLIDALAQWGVESQFGRSGEEMGDFRPHWLPKM